MDSKLIQVLDSDQSAITSTARYLLMPCRPNLTVDALLLSISQTWTAQPPLPRPLASTSARWWLVSFILQVTCHRTHQMMKCQTFVALFAKSITLLSISLCGPITFFSCRSNSPTRYVHLIFDIILGLLTGDETCQVCLPPGHPLWSSPCLTS